MIRASELHRWSNDVDLLGPLADRFAYEGMMKRDTAENCLSSEPSAFEEEAKDTTSLDDVSPREKDHCENDYQLRSPTLSTTKPELVDQRVRFNHAFPALLYFLERLALLAPFEANKAKLLLLRQQRQRYPNFSSFDCRFDSVSPFVCSLRLLACGDSDAYKKTASFVGLSTF